jgi:hypothetical protein
MITDMDNCVFHSGDVIKAFRGLYFHFGVYVGNDRVVHFSSTGGNELDSGSADIVETSFSRFAKNDIVLIDTSVKPTFEREEIVRRARAEVGTKLGTYNLLSNNCEHFANWCRCGTLVSHQKIFIHSLLEAVLPPKSAGRTIMDFVNYISQEKEKNAQSMYNSDIKGLAEHR